jgi:hypothetical protein
MASALVEQIVVANCRAEAVAVAENWAVYRHNPNLVPPDFRFWIRTNFNC